MYTTRFYTKYITIHINQRLVENTKIKLLFLSGNQETNALENLLGRYISGQC
jgi:hypothetical protein